MDHNWVFAHRDDNSTRPWLLFGKIRSILYMKFDNICEVKTDGSELFYGEGEDYKYDWQPGDAAIPYIVNDNNIFDTEAAAQRYGISALFAGKVFG